MPPPPAVGKDPVPPPRWFGNRLSSEIGAVEYGYVLHALDQLAETKTRLLGPPTRSQAHRVFLAGCRITTCCIWRWESRREPGH